jgi:hypothetical protein
MMAFGDAAGFAFPSSPVRGTPACSSQVGISVEIVQLAATDCRNSHPSAIGSAF